MNYIKVAAKLLRALGASGMYCGFGYTISAISMAFEDKMKLSHVTKGLYLDVAKEYHTSWTCVERDIRKMIEIIWNYGDRELLLVICGEKCEKRPPNTEFLERLTEYIENGDWKMLWFMRRIGKIE